MERTVLELLYFYLQGFLITSDEKKVEIAKILSFFPDDVLCLFMADTCTAFGSRLRSVGKSLVVKLF
jgi:hypothetical protein